MWLCLQGCIIRCDGGCWLFFRINKNVGYGHNADRKSYQKNSLKEQVQQVHINAKTTQMIDI